MSALRIIDEGSLHVVVFKPANQVVVKGRGVMSPTTLDLAQAQLGKNIRPVHRLDRVTSGCLLFAKSLFAQQSLSNAFRRHLIDKRYLAIVEGNPRFTHLNIDARLERHDHLNAKKGPLASQEISDEGKRALTRIKVWVQGKDYALVEAQPQTGRMHQIRAHLAHVGHPIVGDKQYGATAFFGENSIALLALAISFPLPKEKRRKACLTQLPPEFETFCLQNELRFQEIFQHFLQKWNV